jgi:hypothetical protein
MKLQDPNIVTTLLAQVVKNWQRRFRLWPAAAITAIGILYVIILATALGPLNGFWSSDQGVKVIQVTSLLLNKFRTNALIYPGSVYDPEIAMSPLRGQYLQHGGDTYAMFSAQFAFASSIPFFLFGYPGLYIIPIVSTLCTLRAVATIGRSLLSPGWVLISILLCGLTTPLFFYSLVFWEHTLATLLVTTALALLLLGMERKGALPLFIAGLFLGAAPWFRNETMLAIPAVLFALVVVRRTGALQAMAWVAMGALLSVGILLVFNQSAYGSFVGPHVLVASRSNYTAETSLASMVEQRFNWATILLVPRAHRFFVIDLGLFVAAALIGNTSRNRAVIWLSLVTIVVFAMRLSSLVQYESSAGLHSTLLETFPLVLLCLVPRAYPEQAVAEKHQVAAPAEAWAKPQIAAVLGLFALGYIGLAWLAYIPDGGTQWGPRVLLPAIPPLVLVALWRLSTWFNRSDTQQIAIVLALALVLLSGTSLLGEVYGLRQIYNFNSSNAFMTQTVNHSGEQVIITDTWYAPALLAPIFYDGHLIYLVDTPQQFEQLVDRLAEHKVAQFYYLGAHISEICSDSAQCQRLSSVGAPQRLPNNLVGRVYAIHQ